MKTPPNIDCQHRGIVNLPSDILILQASGHAAAGPPIVHFCVNGNSWDFHSGVAWVNGKKSLI